MTDRGTPPRGDDVPRALRSTGSSAEVDPGLDGEPAGAWAPGPSFEVVLEALRAAGVEPELSAPGEARASCPCLAGADPDPRAGDHGVVITWIAGETRVDCAGSNPHAPSELLEMLDLEFDHLVDAAPDREQPRGLGAAVPREEAAGAAGAAGTKARGKRSDFKQPPQFPLAPTAANQMWAYSTGADGWERGVYGGIIRRGEVEWSCVGPLPYVLARIAARDGHGRRSAISYQLSMTPSGGDVSTVSQRQLETGEWGQNLDVGFNPNTNHRNAIAAAIADLSRREQPVAHDAAPRWLGDELHLPPRDASPSGYGAAAPITEQRARELWRELLTIAARNPKVALLIGGALGGLFVRPMRDRGHHEISPFTVLVHGLTSNGKSSGLLAAGATLGRPFPGTTVGQEECTVSGSDVSPAYVMSKLASLSVLPLILDELKEAKVSQRDLEAMLMAIGNGAQARRSSRTGESRISGRWDATFLAAANHSVLETAGQDAQGLVARIVEIPSPLTSTPADSDQLKTLAIEAYGWPFRWLQESTDLDAFMDAHRRALADIGGPTGGVGQRLARALAICVAGAGELDRLVGAQQDLAAAAALAARAVLAESVSQAAVDTPGVRLMHAIAVAHATRRRYLPSRQQYAAFRAGTPGADVPADFDGFDLSDDSVPGDVALYKPALERIARSVGLESFRQALRELRDDDEPHEHRRLVVNEVTGRLQYELRMLSPCERDRAERVYVFRLDDAPGQKPCDGRAPVTGDHPATGDHPDGPQFGPAWSPDGASQSGDQSIPAVSCEDSSSRGSGEVVVPTVPTSSAQIHVMRADALPRGSQPAREDTGGMGLFTLVAHLRTLDGDSLTHFSRVPIPPTVCPVCDVDTEISIGGVAVHGTCLRTLLIDAGPVHAPPADTATPPSTAAGTDTERETPAPGPAPATAAVTSSDSGEETGFGENLTTAQLAVCRRPTTALPRPGKTSSTRWRHAVAVVDTDSIFFPDGSHETIRRPEGAADVLALGDQYAIGSPNQPGMLILTEELCDAVGLHIEAPAQQDWDKSRNEVFEGLAHLGSAFLDTAIEDGWRLDGRGDPPLLTPLPRLRRRTSDGERVLQLMLEPYVWVWDQRGTGLVEGVLPDVTDAVARWSELARRAGVLEQLLGVQYKSGAGQVGADLFDVAQQGRRGQGVDAGGRDRGRVVTRAGFRPELPGYRPGTPIEPPMRFSPPGGISASTREGAEWAHGFDVRASYLAATKVPLPYTTEQQPEPTHHDRPEEVLELLSGQPVNKLPWSLVRLTLPGWDDPRLPEPHPYQRRDEPTTVWVTPPTLRLLLADEDSNGPGYRLEDLAPSEMWRWPEYGQLLDGLWYKTVSTAYKASADDPAVQAHLKLVFAGYIGRMESAHIANSGRPHHYQPLWAETIRAQARVTLWQKLRRAARDHGLWPMHVHVDEVVYFASGPGADAPSSVQPATDNGNVGALRYKGDSMEITDRVRKMMAERGGHLTAAWADHKKRARELA